LTHAREQKIVRLPLLELVSDVDIASNVLDSL